jgi:SHS family sialic acid transporter-like MFS transporter
LGMIVLWLPETTYPTFLRIGGSVFGVLLAVAGFMFPVFRYLKRAGAASSATALPIGATLRRMILGACLSGVALVGTWASVQLAPSWAGKVVEARAAADANATSITSAKDSARSWTQMLSGLGAIVGSIVGPLMGTAIGRRPTYAFLCLGSLASALWFYLGNDAFGPMFLVSITLVGGLTASFYGWLPLYLPELFPTRLRATGQGFSFNFGRIIAAVAALQTGPLMGLFGQNKVLSHAYACSTVSLVYVVGMAIIWLAPETHGRPLPE